MNRNIFRKTILIVITVFCCFSFKNDYSSTDFDFLNIFSRLKIKSKLKVVYVREKTDNFFINLNKCYKQFYKDIRGTKTYFLVDKGEQNKILITEYAFKDVMTAKVSYEEIYKYADFTRKLSRIYYNELCFVQPDPQIYYALVKGNKVYLFTTHFNFTFPTGKESVETNIKDNKLILLDDLYDEMGRGGNE